MLAAMRAAQSDEDEIDHQDINVSLEASKLDEFFQDVEEIRES